MQQPQQQPQQTVLPQACPVMMPMAPAAPKFRRLKARNMVFKVGVGGLFFSTLLFIVGFSAPAWVDQGGLWMACGFQCSSNVGNGPGWFDAVRVMETFALVSFLVCVGVELYQDVFKSPPPRDNKAVEILAGLAGLFGLIGIAIFGAKAQLRYHYYQNSYSDSYSGYYFSHRLYIQWGFGLAAAGSILALPSCILIAYSRAKHATQTNLALAAAGIYVPAPQPSAPAPMMTTMAMQPMQPMQPMQAYPGGVPGAPAGYYPYMPAYPQMYPYPYPPPAVTPLTAPPMAAAPAGVIASPTPAAAPAATPGLPTSQVPAFYVMRQGQMVPVYNEMPTAATTAASPATAPAPTDGSGVPESVGVDGHPSRL